MISRPVYWSILVVSILLLVFNIDNRGLDVDELFSHTAGAGHVWWFPAPCVEEAEFNTDCLKEASSLSAALNANSELDRTNGWLYVTGLYGWMKMFGYSQVAARMFSLLFFLLSVWMVFLLSNKFFKSDSTARLASLLFLINPIAISLGWITRSYAAATFFGLASTYFMVVMLQGNWSLTDKRFLKNVVAYLAVSGIAIFVHYYAIILVGMHSLLVLLHHHFKIIELIKYAVIIGASFVPFAVFLVPFQKYHIITRMGGTAKMWADVVKSGNIPDVLQEGVLTDASPKWLFVNWVRTIGGYLNIDLLALEPAVGIMSTAILIALVLLIPIWLITRAVKENQGNSLMIHFLWLAPLAWLALATLSSVSGGQTVSFFQRYTIFYIPFGAILLGVGMRQLRNLDGMKKVLATIGVGSVLILSLITDIPKFVDGLPGSYVSESNIYEDGAHLILKEVSEGELIEFSNRKAMLMTNMTMPIGNGIRQTIMDPSIEDRYIVNRIGENKEELISVETTLYD